MSAHGGKRRGSGPKKKHNVPQGQQTTTICIDLNVYARWCAIKVRLSFKTHNNIAEYLLNAAELLDNEPTLRYATDKSWHVDFNCFARIIL